MKDGFADLRTPQDLVRSLEHDRKRMNADPMDTYAAFDFFVTAEHVLDWHIPDESPKRAKDAERKARRDAEPLLQIVSRIASGAKHFRALRKQHTSVQDVEAREGGFSPSAFSPSAFSPSAFSFAGLHIEIDGASVVHAFELADDVIAYWKRELGM